MHNDLDSSGLGSQLKIRAATENLELAPFLGKLVRYKRDLLTPEFIKRNGTVSESGIFHVREVQKDYAGVACLRGYNTVINDTFGRVLNFCEVEIVDLDDKKESSMKTPYELGKLAFDKKIRAACNDKAMMDWLKDNTSGKVGTGIAPLKEWNKGFNDASEEELRKDFPEMYP